MLCTKRGTTTDFNHMWYHSPGKQVNSRYRSSLPKVHPQKPTLHCLSMWMFTVNLAGTKQNGWDKSPYISLDVGVRVGEGRQVGRDVRRVLTLLSHLQGARCGHLTAGSRCKRSWMIMADCWGLGNHHIMLGGSWGITGCQGAATLGGSSSTRKGKQPLHETIWKPLNFCHWFSIIHSHSHRFQR